MEPGRLMVVTFVSLSLESRENNKHYCLTAATQVPGIMMHLSESNYPNLV